jgi:excisionase family DNA binding protein
MEEVEEAPMKSLTRAEAAAILSCGERHISTLFQRKRIKGRRLGRVLRLDPVSVEEYKRDRQPPGRPRMG